MLKIAFIGGGNMARAIIAGLVKQANVAQSIYVKDPNAEKLESLRAEFGIIPETKLGPWLTEADVVVLAVKPQVLEKSLRELVPYLSDESTILSVAAAVSTQSLRAWSGKQRIVRALPNTPAFVGKGLTGLWADVGATEVDRLRAESILKAVGQVHWCKTEDGLHVVTCGPGSGPAYVFLMMQGMQEALVMQGLTSEEARAFVLATFDGATTLAQNSPESFETLRERVTSRGGTTAKAVEVFENHNLRKTIAEAVQACRDRSEEMAALLS